MTRTTLAVAADYADAMLVARRWKNLLFLALLLFLLIQIGVFCFVRFYNTGTVTVTAGSTTQPAFSRTHDLEAGFVWLINFTDFLAVISVIVLAAVLLLIVGIMLVGRLIGVAHVTSAFVWCIVLFAIMFPWQSLWNYPIADTAQIAPAATENVEVGPRFGLPGVLYTWPELEHRAHFANDRGTAALMGWARFIGWPLVAIIVLFSVQVRSSRGLKFALGEADVRVADVATTAPPGTV